VLGKVPASAIQIVDGVNRAGDVNDGCCGELEELCA
jgi:hypothetical protein